MGKPIDWECCKSEIFQTGEHISDIGFPSNTTAIAAIEKRLTEITRCSQEVKLIEEFKDQVIDDFWKFKSLLIGGEYSKPLKFFDNGVLVYQTEGDILTTQLNQSWLYILCEGRILKRINLDLFIYKVRKKEQLHNLDFEVILPAVEVYSIAKNPLDVYSITGGRLFKNQEIIGLTFDEKKKESFGLNFSKKWLVHSYMIRENQKKSMIFDLYCLKGKLLDSFSRDIKSFVETACDIKTTEITYKSCTVQIIIPANFLHQFDVLAIHKNRLHLLFDRVSVSAQQGLEIEGIALRPSAKSLEVVVYGKPCFIKSLQLKFN